MKRRELLATGAATLAALSAFPLRWVAGEEKRPRRVLYFTRCAFTKTAGYEHGMVHRNGDELAPSEKVLTDLGRRVGLDVVCSKDGRLFDSDLDQFDCLAFYTSSGDQTLPNVRNDPPMTLDGKKRLLDAIAAGKPCVGIHAAICMFRAKEPDPFLQMLGGEFVIHGAMQPGVMRVASPTFPGVGGLGESFTITDEWYAMRRFDPEMHVVLVQETAGLKDDCYRRPPYPATWAKMHGRGRVFFTSMGHRLDVWTNKQFQDVLLGGLAWALGNVEADIAPNFKQITPEAPTG